MNEDNLIKYYNKFNEDKRLTRRHGIIEYTTSMKYIHKYLKKIDNPKIIDIGAGTGKYSCTLYDEGYDITAVELIKHNLMTLKNKMEHAETGPELEYNDKVQSLWKSFDHECHKERVCFVKKIGA